MSPEAPTILDPRERMIRQQIVERGLTAPRLLDALRATPRELFVPDRAADEAYADRALELGHGQTVSQPYIVALMTDRLDVHATHRVLEVGTGSGYQTAVLARLAGEVFSVERVKPLLDDAFERLAGLGLRNVHLRFGDGYAGWPEHGPFDRVMITAAPAAFPDELLRTQLKDGGVAVLPVGEGMQQTLERVERRGGDLVRRAVCGVRFVPMLEDVVRA